MDPDNLPEDCKEHGFDNLDFDYCSKRLHLPQKCAAVWLLSDYPITAIRTGQFEWGWTQLSAEEFDFTEDLAGDVNEAIGGLEAHRQGMADS